MSVPYEAAKRPGAAAGPPADLLGAIGARRLGEPETPTLNARRDGRSLTFWCRWCRTWHRHSAHSAYCDPAACACPLHTDRWARFCLCPTGAADGHRGAHCTSPRSPYRPGGYILREVNK